MIKTVFKKLQSKKVVLTMILFLVFFLSIWGFRAVYAYYNSTSTVSLLGTMIGDFNAGDKDADVNVLLYMQDETGEYNHIKSIPPLGYTLNENMTNCSPNNATYTINTTRLNVTVKATGKTTCKFYFDKTIDADVIVYTMLEDASGSKEFNGNKYRSSALIPAYGYVYNDYECNDKEATTLSYDEITKKYSFKTTKRNVCYAYFNRVGPSDVNVYVYVQSEWGGSNYRNVLQIPNTFVYKLSEVKQSYCENGGNISYTNGNIKIDSTSKGDCYVYLDIS